MLADFVVHINHENKNSTKKEKVQKDTQRSTKHTTRNGV
jgi:hypothetical protein